MKKKTKLILGLKDQRGVTIIVLAISIIMLLSIIALAVDIGYVMVVKNELHNIADASSLAATRQLGAIYETMSYQEQQNYVCDPATIIQVAKGVAAKNQAGGKSNTINDADVIIGTWNAQTKFLTPTLEQPDAVRVIARRDDVANGPITTFFARVFGINTVPVSADATAALTGQSTAPRGGLPLPVGISKYGVDPCIEKDIRFYPTNDPLSCGGWHTYTTDDPYGPNANDLRKLLKALKDGKYQSPETIAGETKFEFTGGTLASVFDDMKALFDAMKVLNDGKLDNDEDSSTWTTTAAVYDSDDCSNPNQTILIVDFVTVTITKILETPEKIIEARIKCNYVDTSRGSGGNSGANKGSIPGLVE